MRPKKNSEAGKLAAERWRKTMEKRYGGASKKMAEVGAIGGRRGHFKGFSSNPELARKAGQIGGLLSRRGKGYDKEWNKYGAEILAKYDTGEYSMAELARKYKIEYGSLRRRIMLRNPDSDD